MRAAASGDPLGPPLVGGGRRAGLPSPDGSPRPATVRWLTAEREIGSVSNRDQHHARGQRSSPPCHPDQRGARRLARLVASPARHARGVAGPSVRSPAAASPAGLPCLPRELATEACPGWSRRVLRILDNLV